MRGNQNRKYYNFFLCPAHLTPSENETSLFFGTNIAFTFSQDNIRSSKLIHTGV